MFRFGHPSTEFLTIWIQLLSDSVAPISVLVVNGAKQGSYGETNVNNVFAEIETVNMGMLWEQLPPVQWAHSFR